LIPRLKDYVYDKKIDSTYEEIVKRNDSEDGSEELWTDLFHALKEAYKFHSEKDDRVRVTLLDLIARNCHLSRSHESFKRSFADLVNAQPDFGVDFMVRTMASNQIYLSAPAIALVCRKCKEGVVWPMKCGKEPLKHCPFCGKEALNQKGKDSMFSNGRWLNITTFHSKIKNADTPVEGT